MGLRKKTDFKNTFQYHNPSAEQIGRMARIRDAGAALATAIEETTESCADQSAAIRKVREAVMTGNAAVVFGDQQANDPTVAT